MKTLIFNPKSEEQKHRENSILSVLKEATRNPRIKFPDYIYFRLEGNTLNIEIVPSIRNILILLSTSIKFVSHNYETL